MRFRVARAAGADRRKAEGRTRLFSGKHDKEDELLAPEAYFCTLRMTTGQLTRSGAADK